MNSNTRRKITKMSNDKLIRKLWDVREYFTGARESDWQYLFAVTAEASKRELLTPTVYVEGDYYGKQSR